MSKIQRFNSFAVGLLMVFYGFVLYWAAFISVNIICMVSSVALLVVGIKNLYYYVTMARHMVGGKYSLFYGFILMDLGIFASMINSLPRIYIMLYLLVIHTFYGATDVMVALQAKKLKSSSWRLKMITGLGNITVGILAMYFGFTEVTIYKVIYIYALGMAYTGVMKMANAFRRTAVPYIQ